MSMIPRNNQNTHGFGCDHYSANGSGSNSHIAANYTFDDDDRQGRNRQQQQRQRSHRQRKQNYSNTEGAATCRNSNSNIFYAGQSSFVRYYRRYTSIRCRGEQTVLRCLTREGRRVRRQLQIINYGDCNHGNTSSSTTDTGNIAKIGKIIKLRNGQKLFYSRKILFLDVDGVILPAGATDFPQEMESLLKRINKITKCDIVVSSAWQHKAGDMNRLELFLNKCGWESNRIHGLIKYLNLRIDGIDNSAIGYNRHCYEEPPYCRSRALGILAFLKKFGQFIDNWVILDDLELDCDDLIYTLGRDYNTNKMLLHAACDEMAQYLKNDCYANTPEATLEFIRDMLKYGMKGSLRYGFKIQTKRNVVTKNSEEEIIISSLDEAINFHVRQVMITFMDFGNDYERERNTAIALCNIVKSKCKCRHWCIQTKGCCDIRPHFIRTDEQTGLTKSVANRVIAMLNSGGCGSSGSSGSNSSNGNVVDVQNNPLDAEWTDSDHFKLDWIVDENMNEINDADSSNDTENAGNIDLKVQKSKKYTLNPDAIEFSPRRL